MSHQSADPTRFGPPGPAGHLSPERLAALVDERPSPAEAGHLEGCLVCRRERDAVAGVIDAARTAPARVGPPLTDWASLSAALRAEGLVAAPVPLAVLPASGGADVSVVALADAAATRRRGRGWRTPATWWRAAAAVLLLAGGAAVGRLSAGAAPVPGLGGGSAAVAVVEDSAAIPRSSEEAMAVLARAERDYRTATAFLAAQADPTVGLARPELYQRRLAVMDQVAAITRAALHETPHDPVLNQYYLASLGAREATLQQLNVALPQGTQLNRF